MKKKLALGAAMIGALLYGSATYAVTVPAGCHLQGGSGRGGGYHTVVVCPKPVTPPVVTPPVVTPPPPPPPPPKPTCDSVAAAQGQAAADLAEATGACTTD